jgi:hypothetical protein
MRAVTASQGVKVICTRDDAPGKAWPAAGFTVKVNATGGPEGCEGVGEDTAKVTVNDKPDIKVTVEDANVCEDDAQKTLDVTLSSDPDAKLTIAVEPDYCKASKTTDGEYQAAAATTCLFE